MQWPSGVIIPFLRTKKTIPSCFLKCQSHSKFWSLSKGALVGGFRGGLWNQLPPRALSVHRKSSYHCGEKCITRGGILTLSGLQSCLTFPYQTMGLAVNRNPDTLCMARREEKDESVGFWVFRAKADFNVGLAVLPHSLRCETRRCETRFLFFMPPTKILVFRASLFVRRFPCPFHAFSAFAFREGCSFSCKQFVGLRQLERWGSLFFTLLCCTPHPASLLSVGRESPEYASFFVPRAFGASFFAFRSFLFVLLVVLPVLLVVLMFFLVLALVCPFFVQNAALMWLRCPQLPFMSTTSVPSFCLERIGVKNDASKLALQRWVVCATVVELVFLFFLRPCFALCALSHGVPGANLDSIKQ